MTQGEKKIFLAPSPRELIRRKFYYCTVGRGWRTESEEGRNNSYVFIMVMGRALSDDPFLLCLRSSRHVYIRGRGGAPLPIRRPLSFLLAPLSVCPLVCREEGEEGEAPFGNEGGGRNITAPILQAYTEGPFSLLLGGNGSPAGRRSKEKENRRGGGERGKKFAWRHS